MNNGDHTFTPNRAFQFLSALDESGVPWYFVGTAETHPKTLHLMVDGNEASFRIVLHGDGRWVAHIDSTEQSTTQNE